MEDLAALFDDSLHVALREAADAGPVGEVPSTGARVVLRHADIERLAHDRRLVGMGLTLFDLMEVPEGPLRSWYGSLMFSNEGDAHHRLRSLVARAFTPRAVARLRAAAGDIARTHLEPVAAAGGGDLVEALALVPAHVMGRLLGVPASDVPDLAGWAEALSRAFGIMDAQQVAEAEAAITDLLDYVAGLAAERRRDPGDDLISGLLAAEEAGDRLTHDELLAMVANLIVGGHDTTASQTGCTLLALLRHPAELARVRGDTTLVGSAVVETIRYEPSVAFVPRLATVDVEVADTVVPTGSLVMLATAAANREPEVWPDPAALDVARFCSPDAPRLLTFGAGPHYCLGTALARLTLEEVLTALVALPGDVEPAADLDAVAWRMVLGRSPAALPVTVG